MKTSVDYQITVNCVCIFLKPGCLLHYTCRYHKDMKQNQSQDVNNTDYFKTLTSILKSKYLRLVIFSVKTNWTATWENAPSKMPKEDSRSACAPAQSDQSFRCPHKKRCILRLGYPKCGKWRFWSDCANAQADLNLRLTHMFEGTFSDVAVHLLMEIRRTLVVSKMQQLQILSAKESVNATAHDIRYALSVCINLLFNCWLNLPMEVYLNVTSLILSLLQYK